MKHLFFAGLAACSASPGGAQVPLTLDTSFRCGLVYASLTDAHPLADGRLWIVGRISFDGTNPVPSSRRLLPNGSLDPEIGLGSLSGGTIVETPEYFYSPAGGGPRRMRLDGTAIYDFNPGPANTPYPGLVGYDWGDINVQSDGKILCTGASQLDYAFGFDSPGWYSVFRLCDNARLDSTYDMRTTDGTIWSLEPTGEDQFFASGVFTTYEGVPVGRIVRIWADGELDTTYQSPILKGYAKCFIQQPDGRMIVGGQFVLPNDPDTMHLIRLLPDGALDSTFHNHTEYKHLPQFSFGDFAFGVNDIEQLADGNIIVGGNFTHMDGQLRRGVALVDSLGNLLNTAFTGAGCGLAAQINSTHTYSGLASIDPAPDGSIYLVGEFNGFDDGVVSDTAQRMICRLHGLNVGVSEHQAKANDGLRVYPNPGSGQITVEWPGHLIKTMRFVDAQGRCAYSITCASCVRADVNVPSSGLYVLIVEDEQGDRISTKLTKP